MTQTVYLHVGGPKSGTTYIQQVLEANRDTLASAGVAVIGPRIDLIHAAMVVRQDRRLDKLGAGAAGAWQRVVEAVRAHPGHAAVISYELFAGATREQASAAIADLAGLDVHVVVTARDLGKSIPSSWQEQLKFGVTTRLEDWTPPAETAVGSEWGWRTMQPAGVAARWGADLPAERVHVIPTPGRGKPISALWDAFAEACSLEGVQGIDLEVERANESLGLVEAELLRRVNAGLAGRIKGGREKSLWLRDLLAHKVLAGIGREPIGLSDAHRLEAEREAEAAIAAITSAGYRVHGDLADLRPQQSSAARLPGDVADHELLDSAALAIGDLLVFARSAGADPHADLESTGGARASTPARGAKAFARGIVDRVTASRRDDRVAALRERVAELEAQVHEARALHLRVATLSDVVEQLLLPASQRDERVTTAALREYRSRSL